MAPDTPRALYVLLLAATALLVGIAVGNSARAECDQHFSYPLGNAYVCADVSTEPLPAAWVVSPVEPSMPTFQTLAPGGGTSNAMPIVYGSGVSVLPDPAKTPGAIATSDRADIVAVEHGLTYTKRHRVWDRQEETFGKYGIFAHRRGEYEDDDRVPVCLGGDNANPLNHWPQPSDKIAEGGFGFETKDIMDAGACRFVKEGKADVDTAQGWFLEPDWRRPYCANFGQHDPKCAAFRP